MLRVRELIEILARENPDALVTYWDDVHEGSNPAIATGVRREFVKPDQHGQCSHAGYSDTAKPGYLAALRIE